MIFRNNLEKMHNYQLVTIVEEKELKRVYIFIYY